jgi:hypothetical protein
MNDLFNNVIGYTKAATELLLSLVVVALMVDVLFEAPIGIVDNVAALIDSFVSNGVVGLIALLFFLAIYKN